MKVPTSLCQLTSEAVVRAHLDRIDQVYPKPNAVVWAGSACGQMRAMFAA